MMTPGAAAISECEKLVALSPFGGRNQKKCKLGALVAFDRSAQFVEAGHSRAFACVVEPAFGGEGRKLACVRGRGHLSPGPQASDFRFAGEAQFDRVELACCLDMENGRLH